MRIENLRTEIRGRKVRRVATVIWEDSPRPTRDVYFATDEAYAADLAPGQHAFLTACLIPAMRHGERRIKLDEPIAPELRNGLHINMVYLRSWYGTPRNLVQIEASTERRQPIPRTATNAASFLSGGIDSLATLRANRLNYPADHPYSIADCLIVHGFDIGGREAVGDEADFFDRTLATLTPIAQDARVHLIPVATNIRHLDDDVTFWMYEFHGAALAAVAHALCRRISRVCIAGTMHVPFLEPWGSHPALDSNYSSVDLQVEHDGLAMSRLEKVQLIADWDVALRDLRVCTMNPARGLNCGRCEKCLRTMLELLACGKLARTSAFPAQDVTADQILNIHIDVEFPAPWYQELVAPLTDRGRADLAHAIQEKLNEFEHHKVWQQEKDWKGLIKRFDRRFLRGVLYQSYRATRQVVRSKAPMLQLLAGAATGLDAWAQLPGGLI
ncbi:hypothetical protein ANRL3_00482 [Anaerolineae bacterium]|nr:hypothetical protein ANRL3_00482 [Anaerolineae bacterium]